MLHLPKVALSSDDVDAGLLLNLSLFGRLFLLRRTGLCRRFGLPLRWWSL